MVLVILVDSSNYICCSWLHAFCDGLKNEEEAEKAIDYGYHCLHCRPVTGQHGPRKYIVDHVNIDLLQVNMIHVSTLWTSTGQHGPCKQIVDQLIVNMVQVSAL